MEMNFCRRCGAKLEEANSSVFKCSNGHTLYTNPAPASSVFLINDSQEVLLSVRGVEPYKGMLDAPGGFVDAGESLEDAAAREIQEELGLAPEHYESPHFLCSDTAVYPYQGEDRIILGTFFWARLKPGAKPIAADDVASIQFVPINNIELSLVGNQDVKDALKKLQTLFSK